MSSLIDTIVNEYGGTVATTLVIDDINNLFIYGFIFYVITLASESTKRNLLNCEKKRLKIIS